MCASCEGEYGDPLNRRIHAEPNACPDCGPSLAFLSTEELSSGEAPPLFTPGYEIGAVLDRARSLLREGRILAIKGLPRWWIDIARFASALLGASFCVLVVVHIAVCSGNDGVRCVAKPVLVRLQKTR